MQPVIQNYVSTTYAEKLGKMLLVKPGKEADAMTQIAGFFGLDNEWYPVPEMHSSRYEKCARMESKQPWYWFDTNRFVISLELNKEQPNMDDYCDSPEFHAATDPRFFYGENSTEAAARERAGRPPPFFTPRALEQVGSVRAALNEYENYAEFFYVHKENLL